MSERQQDARRRAGSGGVGKHRVSCVNPDSVRVTGRCRDRAWWSWPVSGTEVCLFLTRRPEGAGSSQGSCSQAVLSPSLAASALGRGVLPGGLLPPALLPGALPGYTQSPPDTYSPSRVPECVLPGYKEQDSPQVILGCIGAQVLLN